MSGRRERTGPPADEGAATARPYITDGIHSPNEGISLDHPGPSQAHRSRQARIDVEHAVIERHHRRRRNARSADWLLTTGRLVIAYDHPDHADATTARVITLWRRR